MATQRRLAAGVIAVCGIFAALVGTTTSEGKATAAAGKTINIASVTDLTGLAAFYGKADQQGINLAIQQAEKSGPLKGYKINDTFTDTGTTLTGAVAAVKGATTTNAVGMTFGEVSQFAIASMPFAQAAGIPTVLAQSGGPGIVTAGPDIFRTTANQVYYQNLLINYLKKKGIKTAAIIYDTQNSTSTDIGTKIWPGLLKAAGINVVSTDGYTETQTDFSTIASKVKSENPGAMLDSGAPAASTIITQVRQAGYTGQIAGHIGFGGGVLAGVKPQSLVNGTVYTVDYTASNKNANSKKFTSLFTKAYGSAPNLFAAEGYDQANFLLAGIAKALPKVSRASVEKQLLALSHTKFPSVMGSGFITFTQRDAKTHGLVVQWEDGVEKVVG